MKDNPTGAQMVKNIPTVEKQVEGLLNAYPSTKGDDRVLIYRYVKTYCPNIRLSFKTFSELFSMPSFETIRRSRQKLQAQNPTLRPTDRTQRKRYRRSEAMRHYYGSGIKLTDYEVME